MSNPDIRAIRARDAEWTDVGDPGTDDIRPLHLNRHEGATHVASGCAADAIRDRRALLALLDQPASKPDDAGGIDALDRVLAELREEVGRARAKHPPMNSPHEGWAVIREELDPELWAHVCGDTGRSPEAREEALQVAAMGIRYVLDLIDDVPAARLTNPEDRPR